MSEENKRPEYMEEGHLEYLDILRQSGKTNMFAAAEYLTGKKGMVGIEDVELLDINQARKVLSYWMKTF